jgi:photosystem II stability/assembly factor-like uncharacterized protein
MKPVLWLLMLPSVMLTSMTAVNVRATPDDPSTTIDLRGVPAPFSFHRFCRLSSPDMWSVGGDGSIIHQSLTGSRESRPTDQALLAVFFSSSNVGWVIGTNGTILHTEDAGEHWEKQDSGVTKDLNAIACISENDCWVVGRQGTILRTNNGGQQWANVSLKSSAGLNAVSFSAAQNGWAVGDDGLVVHTQDGGLTWMQQYVGMILFPDGPFACPTDLKAVVFVDEKRGWVAGTNGIARTVDGGQTWIKKDIKGSFIGLVSHDGINVWAINDAMPKETNYVSRNAGNTWKKWYAKK